MQSLKVIAILIECIPENIFPRAKKFNILESNFSFLDLLIADLKRYMEKSLILRNNNPVNPSINVISDNSTSISNQDLFICTFEGFYNHRNNIQLRLDFIKYIFPLLKEFTDKDINYHISNVWDIFFNSKLFKNSEIIEVENHMSEFSSGKEENKSFKVSLVLSKYE